MGSVNFACYKSIGVHFYPTRIRYSRAKCLIVYSDAQCTNSSLQGKVIMIAIYLFIFFSTEDQNAWNY